MVLKRLIDITISLFLIVIFSLVYALIFFIIYFTLGSPVFFTQSRVGLDGMIFNLYKFRTMNNKRDTKGMLLPDSQRITKFGNILRKKSLDELPNLFNVLKGDMSLVGPRPLLVNYLGRYNLEQNRRHEVKPGITGWAQVNGRNLISWNEKFNLDVWYVDNFSILLDIKILFFTLIKVFTGVGISPKDGVTMEEFNKNED